jgi:ATP-binding cassette subfamily G (WHITE) protein 2 (SNQ2)
LSYLSCLVGKTTLLDVLAGKKTGGEVTGTLLFNGKPRGREFSHLAGYVEQFDSHNPFSTVREAISFAGRLRLPPETSDAEVEEKVNGVMKTLNISHLANEMIGGYVLCNST